MSIVSGLSLFSAFLRSLEEIGVYLAMLIIQHRWRRVEIASELDYHVSTTPDTETIEPSDLESGMASISIDEIKVMI